MSASTTAAATSLAELEAKFGADTPALDVVKGIDLSKKVAIVTGASSGIGVETARALAHAGAHVILAVRDATQVGDIVADIKKTSSNDKVEAMSIDLGDLKSVAAFASKFLERKLPLNILINNAGVMMPPLTRTKQGFELQFGVNHIGHFYLTVLLLPALQAGKPSRVVSVASIGHVWGDVRWSDPNYKNEKDYDRKASYGQSKTANVLFAKEFNRRYAKTGVIANALHPGGMKTNLARHVDMELMKAEGFVDKDGNWVFKFKTIEAGAATSVLLATSPTYENKGGLYLEDCQVAGELDPKTFKGAAKHLSAEGSGARLWKLTVDLLKADWLNEKVVDAKLLKQITDDVK